MSRLAATADSIVDASVIIASLIPEVDSDRAREALEDALAHLAAAPAHLALEVANTLTVKRRRKLIDPAYRDAALETFLAYDIQVDAPDQGPALRRVQTLCDRHGLTAYDAAYLEAAVRHGARLLTLDSDLASAARREGVVVLP